MSILSIVLNPLKLKFILIESGWSLGHKMIPGNSLDIHSLRIPTKLEMSSSMRVSHALPESPGHNFTYPEALALRFLHSSKALLSHL